jgi:hypothetical protein
VAYRAELSPSVAAPRSGAEAQAAPGPQPEPRPPSAGTRCTAQPAPGLEDVLTTAPASAGTAANGTGIQTGGNGDDGADATDVWLGLGDGGAGGGAAGSSTGAATGGNGGAGGFPGGGGGGGGTGSTQAVGSASTGGTSGAGGDGLIIIEAYA